MKKMAFYDGKWMPCEEVRVPLSDRSVFFGDAIYEAAMIHKNRIYLLKEHALRFFRSARAVGIPLPCAPAELRALTEEAVAFTEGETAFLYLQLARGGSTRAHAWPDGEKSHLLMTVEPTAEPNPERILHLHAVPDIRYGLCDVKTVNLLPNVLASKEAQRRGADEAVFVRDGVVTECAHSNISIICGKRLITHPLGHLILPGTTRARLLSLCPTLGIAVEERPFTLSEMTAADGVLITSSSKLCLRAGDIDGTPLAADGKTAVALCHAMARDFFG